MLLIIYDIKCGFKDLYMTEKNACEDVAAGIYTLNKAIKEDPECAGMSLLSEAEIYEAYQYDADKLFEELFPGLLDCIKEVTCEDYSKTFFSKICRQKGKDKIVCGYFEADNFRLVYDKSVESIVDDNLDITYKDLTTGKIYPDWVDLYEDTNRTPEDIIEEPAGELN